MAASALLEDFYEAFFGIKKGSEKGVGMHRVAVLFVSLVALLMASDPSRTIMQSVAFPWCGLGASFGPVIVMSLYWDKLTARGAMAGIFSGGGFVLVWELLRYMEVGSLQDPDMTGLCLLPACLLSVVMMWIFSQSKKRSR